MEEKCVCEMTREELAGKLEARENEIEMLELQIASLKRTEEFRTGMIEGLKFAIRANGISGAEVR